MTDRGIPIDNSASERALRTFTARQKNWVKIHVIRGAQASAVIYNLKETAHANNLNVYYYMKYLLTELPEFVAEDRNIVRSLLEPLIPWSKQLLADYYSKRRK